MSFWLLRAAVALRPLIFLLIAFSQAGKLSDPVSVNKILYPKYVILFIKLSSVISAFCALFWCAD